MYECEDHGYDGFEPCRLCLVELDIRKAEMQAPKPVVKHVHAPGPCPECAGRMERDATQRWTLLLALLLALAGAALSSALPELLPGRLRAVAYVPAAAVALVGVLLRVPKAHREEP